MIKFIKSLYFRKRLFVLLSAIVILFVFGYFAGFFFVAARLLFIVLMVLLATDLLLVYKKGQGVNASRITDERLSNGDDNPVYIRLENNYPYTVFFEVIDEIPDQFQKRDFVFKGKIAADDKRSLSYNLKPVERGEYRFSEINVFIYSILGLVKKRYRFKAETTVPVYPSFLKMRQYELLAISDRLNNFGIKKIRKIGNTLEFEQIRNYIPGDDYRTINWKATARKNDIMVNQYQDEKSQNVYSIIDMGRAMKMPFAGMSLLDYAINASLILSDVAIHKQDNAGLITFDNEIDTIIPAAKKRGQMMKIMEALYRQETGFLEPNYELLFTNIRYHIKKRSLIILFTNFESLSGMQRYLPYLRAISTNHLVVTVFFKNTELDELIRSEKKSLSGVYDEIIAEKLAFEKKKIVSELKKYGIMTVYSKPENITANTINKYIEIKARRLI